MRKEKNASARQSQVQVQLRARSTEVKDKASRREAVQHERLDGGALEAGSVRIMTSTAVTPMESRNRAARANKSRQGRSEY